MSKISNAEAKAAVGKSLALASVMLTLQMVIFYVSAGHGVGFRPWLFFAASVVHYTISVVVQYKLNPGLLAQRLRIRRKGSKAWDEILMRVANLTVLIAVPAMAGLDLGRYHWSNLHELFVLLGFALFGASTLFLNWAMAVNPHFEPTVRIQKNRGHKVISGGPYQIVRHPGYLAGILFTLSIPLIMGSVFTFVPVGVYIVLFVTRTWLEDRTLQRELDGYSDYAKQVRYRLFPGVW
ncbi:MAG: isoprenylcysteine carboxylmethyltransferase family protein [Candidatus Bathyarchaeota archaeon]|nr:MAG: isoprenylcysteine carboxylmethyltransferase family protein [Candidatus Bathyarchaeota archaeon]